MLTYYTIIGKNLPLIKAHFSNVRKYAGFDKIPCKKELICVQYHNETTKPFENEITEWLESEGIRIVHQYEDKPTFLENLYDGWNLGYRHAKPGYVFRGGSDQVFNRDGIYNMWKMAEKYKVIENKITLQANSSECTTNLRKIGCRSRHFEFDFGTSFEDFDYDAFENAQKVISEGMSELVTIEQAVQFWKKPTPFYSSLGVINRCDGLSWLMHTDTFQKFGPLIPIQNGITGDVLIHDRMQEVGWPMAIVRDCFTYHFVRGESMEKY